MNKILLKLAGLLFIFCIIDILVILYWFLRCVQTQSAFYCDNFMFVTGILLSLGIPALVLLGLSLIILTFSKWYKGNVSTTAKSIIIILGVIIFVAPYTASLLFPTEGPKTYRDYQNRREQKIKELEKQKEEQCAEFKLKMSNWRPGPIPPPTPPFFEECNY